MSSNVNDRISELEKQVRELYVKYDILAGYKEKTQPRETSKEITDDKRPNEFLGDMSLEAVNQMITSIENTNEPFREKAFGSDWKQRLAALKQRKSELEKK